MKRKILIITALFMCLFISACAKVYEKTEDKSFRVIDNVKGLSFDMYKPFLENCLFSTGILETDQLNNGATYVYRNNTTDYMIYNSKSFGAVAQKIDSLNLKGEKNSTIKGRLSSLYFLNSSVTSKASAVSFKDESSKGVTKYITTKQIEVGIAPNVLSYQNYYGYLAYIECDNGEAYALFAGTVNPIDDVDGDVKDMLYHIVASMRVTDTGGLISKIDDDVSEGEVTEPVTFEGVSKPVGFTETESEDNHELLISEPVEIKSAVTEVDVPNKTSKLNSVIKVSAYNGTTEDSMVTVKVVKIDRKAEDTVKKYESEYVPPKDGCHYEMIQFDLTDTKTENDTIRINVVGLDYEKLAYNGIKYSKRTYEVENNGKRYVYYEIPNGCKKYVLEIGGMTEKGYFYVK